MIHHQLDYILTLIDPITDGGVIGPSRFFIDGIAIKVSKQLDNQFVFVNLLNNPKYFHVNGKEAGAILSWNNPNYRTIAVNIGAGESLHRVSVSENYPFSQEQSLIKIYSEVSAKVMIKVPMACGRYHISGAEKGSSRLNLSASKTKHLVGRQFLITEVGYSEQFTVLQDGGLCQLEAPLENSYSEEAVVEEVLYVTVTPQEPVLVPLKAFDRGVENMEFDLIYSVNDTEKPLKVTVSSGRLSEVTLSK